MRHAPCLGAAGAVSLRARAVSSFRTGWSGGRMHGGEAVVYRRERSGREGHRRQSRTGRDAEGVGGVGAWRVLAALAALAPIASPWPAGPAPEPTPQPALDTSAGDSAEGARASALLGRWHRRLPTRLAYSSLSLSPLPLLFLWASATSRDRESTCVEAERGKRRSGGACLQFGRVWVTRIWRVWIGARARDAKRRELLYFENWQRVLGCETLS